LIFISFISLRIKTTGDLLSTGQSAFRVHKIQVIYSLGDELTAFQAASVV